MLELVFMHKVVITSNGLFHIHSLIIPCLHACAAWESLENLYGTLQLLIAYNPVALPLIGHWDNSTGGITIEPKPLHMATWFLTLWHAAHPGVVALLEGCIVEVKPAFAWVDGKVTNT